ncbi:MAG: oxygen-independent coproporphyrinogen III oxidase-like protein [Betaproteobacteria bacterium]|nr:oxygen-independent coproporphyrinogen III oxidase-like protein [Betaproteobacteria bacterium]
MPEIAVPVSGGAAGIRFAVLPPLSVYVHVPWCVRKCPYCDFNSHEVKEALPERDYVAALTTDLESALPQVWGRKVYTVFFGGGTPSLLSARAIDDVLAAIRARLPVAPDAEVTLEANPGTFEAEKFAAYRAAGVNRLSIGIQSFEPRQLRALGRIHDDREARRAIEIAQASFDNFNLDVMYGLPHQTLAEARTDIETAAACGAPHLSAYHLAIEPNTYFHRFPPPLPADDVAADMQEMIEGVLASQGYRNYETSAFARPGSECRHNLNYWRFGDYLGIGAGAHSKISLPNRVLREARVRHPRAYMAAVGRGRHVDVAQEVVPRELPFEFVMNALRLSSGFPLRLFEERTGLPLAVVLPGLDVAEARGFIVRDHERAVPTPLGRRFLNDALQIFLASPEPSTRPSPSRATLPSVSRCVRD